VSEAFRAFEALLDGAGLPDPETRVAASLDQVVGIQDFLSAALQGEDFALACLERDLGRAEAPAGGTDLTPFYKHPQSCVQVALGYWAPGSSAGPHEHSDWTVTAVFHNRLEVTTFDWEIARSERRLQRRHVFPALRGRVGRIYDHGLHDPRNPTGDWTISLHVFGPDRRPKLADEVGPIAALGRPESPPRAAVEDAVVLVLDEAHRQGVLRARVAALAAFSPGPRVASLLEAIATRGDQATRRSVHRAQRPTGAPPLALDRRSVLARGWPDAAPLGVRVEGAYAELTVGRLSPRAILRVQRVAESALRFMAEQRTFALGDVPGGFGLADLRELAEPLLTWGALRVVDVPHHGSEGAM
jgi:hypothetical protein